MEINILPAIISVAGSLFCLFLKFEMDRKEKRISTLEEKLQNEQINQEKANGKIELISQILNRVEAKIKDCDGE